MLEKVAQDFQTQPLKTRKSSVWSGRNTSFSAFQLWCHIAAKVSRSSPIWSTLAIKPQKKHSSRLIQKPTKKHTTKNSDFYWNRDPFLASIFECVLYLFTFSSDPRSGTLVCSKKHVFYEGCFQKLAFRSRVERIGPEHITKEASKMSAVGDKRIQTKWQNKITTYSFPCSIESNCAVIFVILSSINVQVNRMGPAAPGRSP